MNNEKLNVWEIACTLSIITLTPVILSFPQYSAKRYGSASVLHAVYLSVLILIFFSIVFKLYKPFVGKDILDISEMVGGKFLKGISGVLFSLYLFTIVIFTLEEFGQNIKNVMFTNSTIVQINMLFVIGMAILAYFGIKGIFRIGSYILPIVVIGFALMFISLTSKMDLTNLTPVLGTGAKEIFLNGAIELGIFNSLFILFLISPFLGDIKKAGFSSIATTSGVIIFALFLLSTVIPTPSLNQKYFALFDLTRYIGFGRFFQRIESIFTFLWIIACFLFLGSALTFIIVMLKKIFNWKYPNRLIPCFTLLILALSNLIPNYALSSAVRQFLYMKVAPILLFLYPFILLVIARIKVSGERVEK